MGPLRARRHVMKRGTVASLPRASYIFDLFNLLYLLPRAKTRLLWCGAELASSCAPLPGGRPS